MAMSKGAAIALARAQSKIIANFSNPINDALCAFHNSGRNGPNPLNATLELRDPRPSVAKNQRRQKEKQGTWYISNGPTVYKSTGFSELEYDRALTSLHIYISEEIEKEKGNRLPGFLTFDEVLADHVATLEAGATTRSQKLNALREKAMCNTLLNLVFRGRTLASYVLGDSETFKAKLLEIRRIHHEKNGIDPEHQDLDSYPASCLSTLDRAVKKYPSRHGQYWCMPIYVTPHKRRRRTKWLTKDEVIRLLLACMGYVWDYERGRWKTRLVLMPDCMLGEIPHRVNDPDTKFLRQGVSRLIRLILKTGMRHEAALRTKWGSWTEHGSIVFKDVEGNGVVYRRGSQEYNTPKSLGESEIYEELRVMLRVWAKQDGFIADGLLVNKARKPRIIRDVDDKGYNGYALTEFREICYLAGVDTETTIHSLKHTSITWMKQHGFTDESISEMTDTSVATVREVYTHIDKETRRRLARVEFDDRAKRRAWRLVVHNTSDPDEPKRMRDRLRVVEMPVAEAA
jgi:integrase